MTSMFDIYSEEFDKIDFEPQLINNEKDTEMLKILRDERESHFSAFAQRSSESRGRLRYEEPAIIRSCYERDMGRIIFSQSFRRLRHKTQVFFNPSNDHICSRIEHVIYVNYISTIIGRALNLNIDLIQAIAMGHDLGHAPFGHTGERALNSCIKSVDPNLFFEHEVHSLRVIDVLENRKPGYTGLNLSFEVRDGIVSHCGETYNESSLKPLRDKTEEMVSSKPEKSRIAPATLEGCVVRFADKIAYVGRDVEDARRAGIIGGTEFLSDDVIKRLGSTNSETINILVGDLIHNSIDNDEITMSEGNFKAMNNFLTSNFEKIYSAPKIRTYEETIKIQIKAIFDAFMDASNDIEKALHSDSPSIRKFAEFYINHPEQDSVPVRRVVDYIAGMTDAYATGCFDELYRV
ncbi:MAG: HD domain-containing protein [Saccharofermentans sp.]|nr:HD domain-containing protein [Saccharofermentans sp.]